MYDMKKIALLLTTLAALFLSACGSKSGQTGNDAAATDSTTVSDTSAEEQEAKEAITSLLDDLYADAGKNQGGIDAKYACHTWREMVAAVEKKDAQVAEIGFFNEDYWTGMQDSNPNDFEVQNLQFEQVDIKKGTALASFTLYSSVQTVRFKFAFCQEDGNWRVHDIHSFYEDENDKEVEFSYLESMTEYVNEEE